MSAANFKLADALCHTDVYPVGNGSINLKDLPTERRKCVSVVCVCVLLRMCASERERR